jgi:hypothetical protein
MTGLGRCFFERSIPLKTSASSRSPCSPAFAHLLRRERLDPRRCIMVEDSLPNLSRQKTRHENGVGEH